MLYDFSAAQNAKQQIHRQCVDVKWRQDRQNTLVPFSQHRESTSRELPNLPASATKICVREHSSLWQPGGATRVLKHSNGFARIADGMNCKITVVVQQLSEADVAIIR